jgi:UDP-N-acetylmuramyl pentapeptide synthase
LLFRSERSLYGGQLQQFNRRSDNSFQSSRRAGFYSGNRTSAPGEIRREAEICEPDAGLLPRYTRHLEGLGSIEGVAKEKLALFANLAQRGKTLAVNLDDEFVAKGADALNARKITYSANRRDADIRAENIAATDVSVSFDAVCAGGKSESGAADRRDSQRL